MADNKNIEISDEMMAQINGGTASVSEQPFAFAVGDRVTLQYYDQIGIITEAYRFNCQGYSWNVYAVHWLEDPYNQEHDNRDVLECNLKSA